MSLPNGVFFHSSPAKPAVFVETIPRLLTTESGCSQRFSIGFKSGKDPVQNVEPMRLHEDVWMAAKSCWKIRGGSSGRAAASLFAQGTKNVNTLAGQLPTTKRSPQNMTEPPLPSSSRTPC